MPAFSLGRAEVSDGASSDSDHRHKRRKTNPMYQHLQDAAPKSTGPAQKAPPNAFAAKMMAKMGYKEGQGLGASGMGRLAPIETQLRPQGAGLGAVKEKTKQAKQEEKREAAFRGEQLNDSSEEEKKRRKERLNKKKSGVAGGSSTPTARPKQKYRTAAEIEAAAEGLEIPNVLKSIIDATGQETRLLSSTLGLMRAQDSMVTAETESAKLSRMAQRESIAYAEEWRALQERKNFFNAQQLDLLSSAEKGFREGQTVDYLISNIEGLQRLVLNEEDSWEIVTTEIESVLNSNNMEDDSLDLQDVCVAILHPLFKRSMQDWDPFADPKGCAPYLQRLQAILQIPNLSTNREVARSIDASQTRIQNKSTSAYETMIYALWLPNIRSAITRWEVYHPEQCIAVIDAWQAVLPPFILANVVDQLIRQRLVTALYAWKPKRDRDGNSRSSSPERWLFPWFAYLDEQHTDLKGSGGFMSDVKQRLKSVLSTWNLGHGAFPGLKHWQSVFKSDLSHMLVRYVLPRLAEYFTSNFEVDPADQDMAPLEKVLPWVPYFSIDAMAQLFADIFFQKWHNVLYLWLIGDPNHTEIMQWYQWWKQQFVENLPLGFNENLLIARCWDKGLTIINVALDAMERGANIEEELQPYLMEQEIESSVPEPSPNPPISKSIETPTTFKDVLEDWCAEHGLLMFPMREADIRTGLPLFRITASAGGKGGVVLFLKGDVAWIRLQNKSFEPAALDQRLVEKAEGR
ncbi:uncharacterized protein KY384_004292 [Bacidia gigantensis]|uniref:uncharacterized protein n=1 Tax=Bacidia gigantensis TaxID=2732470 RepID=UPI001D059892|nr:uncharacterized protein KY384_004292 [Bacidia gigantensis]KAG8530935.1 hypothetical protein KY384_004292 [Bacidia gigantensis]